MKRRILIALALASFVALSLVQAQEKSEPTPSSPAKEMEIQDINALLDWARNEIGCGFIFDPKHIRDEKGELLKLTYIPPSEMTSESAELCLFECLRPLGIVAMDTVGLDGPTYHLLPIHEAAAYGDVAYGIEQLDGLFFGTLAIEAHSISLEALEALVQRYTGTHAEINTFEDTSVVLVSDFVDHLWTATRAAEEAQIPAQRDDDTVTDSFTPVKHDAEHLRAALDEARQDGERYTLTLHEQSGTLLLTGARMDVREALHRLETLEAAETTPTSRIEMHLLDIRSIPVEIAATALREYFAQDIERLLVRVVAVSVKKQVILECNDARYRAAIKLLREIDPLPGMLVPDDE